MSEDKEHLNLVDKLSREVWDDLVDFLMKDGKIKTLKDSGSSGVAQYIFDPPKSLAGIEIHPSEYIGKEVQARLIISRAIGPSGPIGRILATIMILDEGLDKSSFTYIFEKGSSPSFHYVELITEGSSRDKVNRVATVEDLQEIKDILERPLYRSG